VVRPAVLSRDGFAGATSVVARHEHRRWRRTEAPKSAQNSAPSMTATPSEALEDAYNQRIRVFCGIIMDLVDPAPEI
jgi:hypothetical protein